MLVFTVPFTLFPKCNHNHSSESYCSPAVLLIKIYKVVITFNYTSVGEIRK